jgi:hypothetical protein
MIYKRNKVWYVRIKWKGNLIRQSTGTKSKKLARRIEGKILDELAEGR